MKKRSKRYQAALKAVDLEQEYALKDAVDNLFKFPAAKFDESVELSLRLGVDPRQSDQMVRGTVSLPHGSGKTVRVLVFTEDPDAAKAAGADFAGLKDMIDKVNEGWMDFDVAVATTEAMKEVRTVARVLGPRGLMPNPKSGTVTNDVAQAIQEVKAGRVEFKLDKTANMGVAIGKRSFSAEQIVENANTVLAAVNKARPAAAKGKFILSATVSATMSPGVRVSSGETATA